MSNAIWLKKLAPYEGSITQKSILQITNSIVPFIATIGAMFYLEANHYPYWTVLLLSLVAVMFFVRVFIIEHDCAHNSFLKNKKANDFVGTFCGFLTLMPFREFQHSHNIHHANSGKLEKRGVGDIWTMTVGEYLASNRWTKMLYEAFRNPLVFLTFGPLLLVLFTNRMPSPSSRKTQVIAIMVINLFILASLATAYFTIGILSYVKVMAPVLFISEAIGIWLFFVQHCYEDAYWSSAKDWDPVKAALEGSSFYKLPRVLHWVTGNIGFHHVHHLRSRIPNYRLNQCFKDIDELQNVKPITIAESLRSARYTLWDPESGKMIKFADLKARQRVNRYSGSAQTV